MAPPARFSPNIKAAAELEELEELRELKRECVCENKKRPDMANLAKLVELPRKMQDELWWNWEEYGGIARGIISFGLKGVLLQPACLGQHPDLSGLAQVRNDLPVKMISGNPAVTVISETVGKLGSGEDNLTVGS